MPDASNSAVAGESDSQKGEGWVGDTGLVRSQGLRLEGLLGCPLGGRVELKRVVVELGGPWVEWDVLEEMSKVLLLLWVLHQSLVQSWCDLLEAGRALVVPDHEDRQVVLVQLVHVQGPRRSAVLRGSGQ